MFSQSLAFATIPKAYGFEAATHFPLILLGGSLIPIVVYWDGDGFSLAKHILCRELQFFCADIPFCVFKVLQKQLEPVKASGYYY